MKTPRPEDEDLLVEWVGADPARAGLMYSATTVTRRARAAWAWFRPSEAFCALFGAAAKTLTQDALANLHWEDLALLDAFRGGQPQAAAVMHQTIATRLTEVLMNHGASEAEADDLVQERFCDLIDGSIATGYAGSGTLIGWLKVGLVRDFARLRKRERRQASQRPQPLSAAQWLGVESAVVVHQHRPHLRAVLREVFLSLSTESRRILRLVHVGGLSAQQVGVLVGLHRVTVQRRLGELRAELQKQTRKRLAARFGLDDSTIRALVDATQQAFETTLSSVLATPSPE